MRQISLPQLPSYQNGSYWDRPIPDSIGKFDAAVKRAESNMFLSRFFSGHAPKRNEETALYYVDSMVKVMKENVNQFETPRNLFEDLSHKSQRYYNQSKFLGATGAAMMVPFAVSMVERNHWGIFPALCFGLGSFLASSAFLFLGARSFSSETTLKTLFTCINMLDKAQNQVIEAEVSSVE